MQSLQRFHVIMQYLADHKSKDVHLTDIAKNTSLSMATTSRLLEALTKYDMVQYDKKTRTYSLGQTVYLWGLSAARQLHGERNLQDFLEKLSFKTRYDSFLNVRRAFSSVCIAHSGGGFPVRTDMFGVGMHRPLGIGANGILFMAYETDDKISEIFAANQQRLRKYPYFSEDTARQYIEFARKNGFVYTVGQHFPDISALAAPVIVEGNKPLYCLATVTLSSCFNNSGFEKIRDATLGVAQEIAAYLKS